MSLTKILGVLGAVLAGIGSCNMAVADSRCQNRVAKIRESGGDVHWLNNVDNMNQEESELYYSGFALLTFGVLAWAWLAVYRLALTIDKLLR